MVFPSGEICTSLSHKGVAAVTVIVAAAKRIDDTNFFIYRLVYDVVKVYGPLSNSVFAGSQKAILLQG